MYSLFIFVPIISAFLLPRNGMEELTVGKSMKKPRIFFDTNVCNDIAYRNLNREWRIVSKYISRHYRYAISPLTMLELMIKIGRGHERYFEKNRRAPNVMYCSRSQ